MKIIILKACNALKSRETIIIEQILKEATKSDVMAREDGSFRPLNISFDRMDVKTMTKEYIIEISNHDLTYTVRIDCNIYIHKYLPLVAGFIPSSNCFDLQFDFNSKKIGLINQHCEIRYVRVSYVMRKHLTKLIESCVTIK